MDHLTARAIRACAISAKRAGNNPPSVDRTSVDLIGGKQYVTLRSAGDVVAVFRVRMSGALKRMKRPPAALTGRKSNNGLRVVQAASAGIANWVDLGLISSTGN